MSTFHRRRSEFPAELHTETLTVTDPWGEVHTAAVRWRSMYVRDDGDGNWYGHALWPADHCPVSLRWQSGSAYVVMAEWPDRGAMTGRRRSRSSTCRR